MSFYVALLRHPPIIVDPSVCYGQSEWPLVPGWEEKLGDFISSVKKYDIHAIYSSPLRRCLDVALFCQDKLDIQVQVDDDLKEMNFGHWDQMTWDEIGPKKLQEWAHSLWDYPIPGGESVKEFVTRIEIFWQKIRRQDKNIAVITHGGVIRILRALAENKKINPLAPSLEKGAFCCYHMTNKETS